MTPKTTTRNPIAPGPKASLLGNLNDFQRDPFELLLSLQQEYGEIVRFRLGPNLVHLVTDPAYIKYVLEDNNANYVRGKFYQNFKIFFGRGILTSDGAFWLKHRRVVQPLFHRHVLNATAGTITDAASDLIARWQKKAELQQTIDLLPEMLQVSLSALSKAMFTVDISKDFNSFSQFTHFILQAMMPTDSLARMLPRWLPTPYNCTITQVQNTFAALIDRVIEAHRSELRSSNDLVSHLLSMQEAENAKDHWTHEEIRDELTTIFLAGYETTGTGLAWTLYAIAQHPVVYQKLIAELDRVLHGQIPSVDDLLCLPYLRQIVDESLRMYPPIWLYPRDSTNDDTIGGYHIPAHTTIVLSPYASHHNPQYWQDPNIFDPERFTPERIAKRPRYAYFPFGGGQRQCIGSHMALLQIQLITAMITQHYHLQVVPGQSIVCGPLVSLRPLNGIQVTVFRRGDPLWSPLA